MVVKLVYEIIELSVTNMKVIVCYYIRRKYQAYLPHRKNMI